MGHVVRIGWQNFVGGNTFLGSLAAKLRIVTEPSHLVSNEPFVCNVQLVAEVVIRVKHCGLDKRLGSIWVSVVAMYLQIKPLIVSKSSVA